MNPDPAAAAAGQVRAATRATMVVILACVAWAGWTAAGYGLWQGIEPGSGLFPLIAAMLAGSFAAVTLLGSLRSGPVGQQDGHAPADTTERPAWRRLAVYAGVVLGWPLLLQPAGFLVSGALALLVLLRFAEALAWTRALAFTGVTLAVSWLLFERLLGVGLPKGYFALAGSLPVA
jgi:hypothetical protein